MERFIAIPRAEAKWMFDFELKLLPVINEGKCSVSIYIFLEFNSSMEIFCQISDLTLEKHAY